MITLGHGNSFSIDDTMIDLTELDYKRQLKYKTSSAGQIHNIAAKYAYIANTKYYAERGRQITDWEEKLTLKKYYELLEMLQ